MVNDHVRSCPPSFGMTSLTPEHAAFHKPIYAQKVGLADSTHPVLVCDSEVIGWLIISFT